MAEIPATEKFFPAGGSLLTRYQARAVAAGVDPLGYYMPPFAYASLEILAQAVTRVGSDQDKLAEYIHANRFQSIVGAIGFGPDGEWTQPRMPTVR